MSRAFLRYLDGRQGRDGRKKLKISNLGFGVDAAGIHDAAGPAFSISGTCNRRDWHLAWPDFCYRGFHLGRMTGIVNENRAAETCRKKEAAVSIDCLRLPLHLKRCVYPGPKAPGKAIDPQNRGTPLRIWISTDPQGRLQCHGKTRITAGGQPSPRRKPRAASA